MIIKMNLENEAFDMVKLGTKDVELRINDEKRQLIEVGDIIIFTNLTTRERLQVKVAALKKYPSFKELYDAYDPGRLGYKNQEAADYHDMYHFYSKDAITSYGALAIEIDCSKETT